MLGRYDFLLSLVIYGKAQSPAQSNGIPSRDTTSPSH
jgi:hypothetical protein